MIILISGKKESGKTEVAEHLRRLLVKKKKTVYITAFANDFKEIAKVLIPSLSRKDFDNSEVKKLKFYEEETIRDLLIFLGENFKARFGDNFWAARTLNKILNIKSQFDTKKFFFFQREEPIFIIPDLRFYKDEYKYFFDNVDLHKLYVIRVERPAIERFEEHRSETELDDKYAIWNSLIHNTGTLQQLKFDVKEKLLPKILKYFHV